MIILTAALIGNVYSQTPNKQKKNAKLSQTEILINSEKQTWAFLKQKNYKGFGDLMVGAAENDAAQSAYEHYVDAQNDQARRGVCLDNEAYKARKYKDDLGALAHAVMATCKSTDEGAALAAVLKYRNCAAGIR